MTGSLLFNRQCSSNGADQKVEKIVRPKLRRCSSADEHNSYEQPALEDLQSKMKSWRKKENSSSDIDSGAEDLDQNQTGPAVAHIEEHPDDESLHSFGACDDEGYNGVSTQMTEEERCFQNISRDVQLASQIRHEEKKYFCNDTSETFHAEFTRLISFPISLLRPGFRYHLFPYDEIDPTTQFWMNFRWTKVDNAKAQFKCSCCHRSWTSMRARIGFYINQPALNGIVALKIFSQKCKSCDVYAEVLWYMEEVCRVMENLAETMFSICGLPHPKVSIENHNDAPVVDRWAHVSQSRHDPKQRHGKMSAPHDRNHCEACQYGVCFL